MPSTLHNAQPFAIRSLRKSRLSLRGEAERLTKQCFWLFMGQSLGEGVVKLLIPRSDALTTTCKICFKTRAIMPLTSATHSIHIAHTSSLFASRRPLSIPSMVYTRDAFPDPTSAIKIFNSVRKLLCLRRQSILWYEGS